eukprot:7797653-Karenia_brevis.AAC.1
MADELAKRGRTASEPFSVVYYNKDEVVDTSRDDSCIGSSCGTDCFASEAAGCTQERLPSEDVGEAVPSEADHQVLSYSSSYHLTHELLLEWDVDCQQQCVDRDVCLHNRIPWPVMLEARSRLKCGRGPGGDKLVAE